VHPDDQACVNEKIQAVLTSDFKGYQYEARLRHADGAYRWQHVQGMSVKRDEDGKVTRMLGIRMDITERKRAEEALRASEEKFRTVADWTYDWEYWVDPMGRLNYMSPSCKRVTGFVPEEFADDPGLLSRIVHPTGRQTYEQHMQHIHKRDAHIEEATLEFRIIALDGTVHWIEHVCRPVYSADGSHLGRRVSNRDVTERKEAQEALRESEEQYRAVFDNAGMGIDLLDRDGRLVKVNKALSNMLGYAEEELRRLTFLDVTHPEDREISKRNLKALLEGEVDSYRLEKRYVKKDGSIVWADLWSTTVRDENGEHAGTVAVIDDITDRKGAEEALRRLNRELRAVSNCNQSVLRALDEQTLVNDICRIICDEAGYRLAWVGYAENDDAKTIRPVAWAGFDSGYVADSKLSWADDTERGRGPAGTVIRSGETVYVQDFTTDPRMVPWRESSLQRGYRSGIALPLKDESAKAFGVLLIYHSEPYAMTSDEIRLMEELAADLAFGISTLRTRAERKRAEEALRESEAFYRSLYENISDCIFIIDVTPEGRFKFVGFNPAEERAVGMTTEQVANRFTDDLVSKEVAEHVNSKYQMCVEKRETIHYEEVLDLPKGKMSFFTSLVPIDGPDGRIYRIIGVARDITEEKSLQSQLLQAQKMEAVGTLAGGMAHDFNNILTAVQGFSELLLTEMDEKAPGYSDLWKINDAGRRGAELVQNLLAFSRKAEIKPRPINLNHEVARIEKLLRRTIPKMIDIELHLERDLAAVNADPGQIGQVLMNLVVNAEQAMPDGGKLTIATTNVTLDEEYCRSYHETQPGSYVMLAVEDTGHGMDKETLEHIFEPFFTTKGVGKGTGLGLAMVYGILRQHGGHITCYSEPRQGTTFKIYLPAITKAETERRADPEQLPPRCGTETILLVDDEDFIRDLGQTFLSRAGYTVLTAASGPEAVQLYLREGERISLLILDLIMPEMGGDKCLEEILAINPDAKILISSGAAVEGKKKETVESGAKGFVNKPFRLREMLKAVRHVLDSE
jgi:PAS domain S-box-containing protein